MSTFLTIRRALAAAVLAVLLGACAGPGSEPTSSPGPTATPDEAARADAVSQPGPALTEGYTSTLHGMSVSYPEGWTAQAATEPWTEDAFPLSFGVPQVDWLYDPTLKASLFLAIASQPIGDSTPEDWVAGRMASDEGCGTTTEPIVVDDATGLIGGAGCNVAVVTTAGRGYWIQLYTGSEAPFTYDTAWFDDVLATVQLHPKEAVGTPPSASP